MAKQSNYSSLALLSKKVLYFTKPILLKISREALTRVSFLV